MYMCIALLTQQKFNYVTALWNTIRVPFKTYILHVYVMESLPAEWRLVPRVMVQVLLRWPEPSQPC